jgi:ABC-type transport system involved in multi-copper enzyme maturation permease subunit
MNTITTITGMTFHEARRRRMVLAALAMGGLFLLLFNIGFSLIVHSFDPTRTPDIVIRTNYSLLLMAGLYVTHFLTVMLAIFASVDTVSGEIASHTIQAIVTKPVRRWHILLGKWLGYAAMLVLYLALLGGGLLLSVYLQVGYAPPNWTQGLLLLMLESLVLLALSLLGGTRLSTLTNGVVLFMLYGLAFIGAWVEQIGAILGSPAAVKVGIATSLLLPVEAIWRRAAYLMQPPALRNIPSPFTTASVPSLAMIVYAIGYTAAALLLAMRLFARRDF